MEFMLRLKVERVDVEATRAEVLNALRAHFEGYEFDVECEDGDDALYDITEVSAPEPLWASTTRASHLLDEGRSFIDVDQRLRVLPVRPGTEVAIYPREVAG